MLDLDGAIAPSLMGSDRNVSVVTDQTTVVFSSMQSAKAVTGFQPGVSTWMVVPVENASYSIYGGSEPSNLTDVSDVHPSNASYSMTVIPAGMSIVETEVHPANVLFSMVSTPLGMSIKVSDVQ